MKGSRLSEEQIIGVLRERQAVAKTPEVCRRHGISDGTFYEMLPAAINPRWSLDVVSTACATGGAFVSCASSMTSTGNTWPPMIDR